MSDQRSFPMTRAMLSELRAELKHKVEVERSALAARLKTAIEMGDLSENADYIAAKEDQSFLEGRIQQLQVMISGATIIQEGETNNEGVVRLGSRVTVVDRESGEPETFLIVGQVEANPLEGKISNESPVGQALVDHKVGETIGVTTPAGQMSFKITAIQ